MLEVLLEPFLKNLYQLPRGGDGVDLEPLRPEGTPNPMLQRFYDFLVDRAIDKGAKVPPAAKELAQRINRPLQVEQRLEEIKMAARLKEAFGLEKVEKKGKKVRKFWREAIAEKRKDAPSGEVDVKRIKVSGPCQTSDPRLP